jgi:hypothetical protein
MNMITSLENYVKKPLSLPMAENTLNYVKKIL